MSKTIKHEELSATIALTECNDGFWLYDKTRSMNLAMRAKDERTAFISAMQYYQRRLTEVEAEHKALSAKVDAFVSQFTTDKD